jgi:hypothetical protein
MFIIQIEKYLFIKEKNYKDEEICIMRYLVIIYFSSDIIRVIKSRSRWAENVTRVEEKRNIYSLVWKP